MADYTKTTQSPESRAADRLHMHVKVYAPYKVYYDDQAESISAESNTGAFDILPQHHNFMTLLSPCTIVVRNQGEEEKIAIQRGIMHVKKNAVIVFLDI